HPAIPTRRSSDLNTRGDRTANTLLTISPTAASSCEDVTHTCTSTVATDHTVTGTDAGATNTTDTATLHVNAAALDHITISPDPATITAGGAQAYSSEGFRSEEHTSELQSLRHLV